MTCQSLPLIRGRQLFLLWKRTIPLSPASRRFPTPNRRPSQSSLPSATLKVLQEAKELRIPSAWLQPGSFDDDVLKFANEQGGFNAVVAGDAGRISKGVAEAINTLAQQENLFKIEVEAAQRPRDAVEDLLRQMVAQLGGINTRLRTFEGSVNRMEATVAGQGERLDNIDERLDSIDGHLANLTSATRNVRARASNARVTEAVTALTPLVNP
ncbi:hypothetical protein FocnCong_v000965 [Fusarium oxysporum f. sp. conglutinans]|nr:hypothetical protein FocnCong_v000965 [Fusarium oxysporum f. sp. conglutinans]